MKKQKEIEKQEYIKAVMPSQEKLAFETIARTSGVPVAVLVRRLVESLVRYAKGNGRLDRDFDLTERTSGHEKQAS